MHYRIMLSFYGLIFAIAAFTTQAQAVSLGKIDVASHLGEPFYAEVPLSLDEGEVISSLYVELATPADYRILEVYRDQALNAVRADVENDSRGSRIELSSRSVMDAPFFNLVLKVRYGRATHYKKYPVFLDLPRAAQPAKQAAALPTITAEEARQMPMVPSVTPVQSMQAESVQTEESAAPISSFQPFDGWARASHYGPMVYGDTISTVADRLRVDARYTRNQVMMAIFEKNKAKFDQDNVNLIKAGTYLDIPMADEVERIRPDQADDLIKEHNQRWRELVKQPHYAAISEAQKTRYSKRVRVGKRSSGVSVAPAVQQEEMAGESGEQAAEAMAKAAPASEEGAVDGETSGQAGAETSMLSEAVAKLQKENEELQAKLAESDAKIEQMIAAGSTETEVAAEARIKKLELQLARLQAELDSARQSAVESEGPDWLMLLGGGLVLVLLGGGAGYLMRRERPHPAMQDMGERFEPASFDDVAAAPVAVEPETPEEIDVEVAEEFSPDATAQMSADDFAGAFTDSIPDLTDEETGEMEAFREDLEEEPDPNVDYLSEADVYMRYGMEDEAEKQVEMALKLRENNKDAHIKMVQIKKARGDESGADEAISTARMTLSDDALSSFEASISGLAGLEAGEIPVEEVSLEDTLPPGTLDVSSDPQAEKSLEDSGDFSDLGDIEFGSEEVVPEESAPEVAALAAGEGEGAETLELGDIEWPSEDTSEGVTAVHDEETVVETPAEVSGPADTGGLDFDLSGLELSDQVDDSAATENEPEVEAAGEVAEKMDVDGLDLSDLDLTGDVSKDTPEAIAMPEDELMTADMDKTVVMDWSKETLTSGTHDVGSESGAGEIDFGEDATPVEADSDTIDLAEEASEPAEHLSSIEFDLEDLDVDLDTPVSSDDADDFSSTIQTSIEAIKGGDDSKAADEPDTTGLDADGDTDMALDLESLDEATDSGVGEDSISAEGLGDGTLGLADNASLEELIEKSADKDFDATMELDSLLSELGGADDDHDDPKKGDS